MPTYDYQCDTCGVSFELIQSFSEDTLKKCPTKKSGNSPAGCTSVGRGKVRKVFSAPGIAFKGSGFYKNDSRSGSSDKSTSDKSGADKKSSDKKSSDTSSTTKTKPDKSSSDSGSSNSKSSTSTSSSSSSSD